MAKQKRRPRYEFTVHMTHDDSICVSWTNGEEHILLSKYKSHELLHDLEKWIDENNRLKSIYG